MTTLVMVQTEDDVILGWDSLVTTGNQAEMVPMPKFFVNGGLIIGVAGTLRALDLMETTDFSGECEVGHERQFLINHVVPRMKAAVAEEPTLHDEDGSKRFGIFIVINGKAFDTDGSYSISQNTDGIYTLGSGCDYARGVLYDHQNQGFPGRAVLDESDVFAALEAAATIDPFTGGYLTVVKASDYIKEQVDG